MIRRIALVPLALLTGSLLTGAAAPDVRTAVAVAGRMTPAWFVCDAAGPFDFVVGQKDSRGQARIFRFSKVAPNSPSSAVYAVADGDAGAGQVHYALTHKGRDAGDLHAVNPGVFDPPAALPPLSSVEVDGVRAECRLEEGLIFTGFTARRGVSVIRSAKGELTYRTFDFARPNAATPSAEAGGGSLTRRGAGGAFRFGKAGYGYEIAIPAAASAPATLTVTRGGRLVQREPFLAYSAAF